MARLHYYYYYYYYYYHYYYYHYYYYYIWGEANSRAVASAPRELT